MCYVNKRGSSGRCVATVPVYIPDFLRRFPRYRNLDNDPIIQYPGAVPLCQISWKLAKLASVLHRFDWLQIERQEPSFTALADSRDQESKVTCGSCATKSSVCRDLSDSDWLISRSCVHARSGWLASLGNRKKAALSAVSWRRASIVGGQYHRCSWFLQWGILNIKWLIVFVGFLEWSLVFQTLQAVDQSGI